MIWLVLAARRLLQWGRRYKKSPGIPEQHTIINIIPAGYPKKEPGLHTDKDFIDRKIHREKW